jgi:hypothetical protein
MWLMLIWLWAGCCSLLLEHWSARVREKVDVVWARLRYNLVITGTSLSHFSCFGLFRWVNCLMHYQWFKLLSPSRCV